MSEKMKVGCGITGFVLLLIAGVVLVRSVSPEFPTPPAPKPLPSPNAYDYYLKATTQMVDSDDVLRMAFPNQTWTLAEKQEILSDNKTALATFRSGLGYEYADPPRNRSNSNIISDYNKFRRFGYVIVLDGFVATQKGEWNRAANAYMDAIQFGVQIPRRANFIASLSGKTIESAGRRNLGDAINHLSVTEMVALLKRWDAIDKQRTTLVDTLREQRYWYQTALIEEYQGQDNLGMSNTWGEKLTKDTKILLYGKATIMKNLNTGFDEAIANAEGAYGDRKPRKERDPFSDYMVSIFDSPVQMRSVANITFDTLLRTSLALRVYLLEHGRYPSDLNALVTSGYLKTIPEDPFARNAPIGYRKEGAKYVLYSIGPDSKDDNGKPIDNPGKPNERRLVKEESKGDIVDGITR